MTLSELERRLEPLLAEQPVKRFKVSGNSEAGFRVEHGRNGIGLNVRGSKLNRLPKSRSNFEVGPLRGAKRNG
jgi:hypothetical protein